MRLTLREEAVRLTKTVVDAARYRGDASKGFHSIIWDDQVPKFGLRVYPSGKKSYVLTYRYRGRRRYMVLGKHGEITVKQARTKAIKAQGDIADGKDPLAEKHRSDGRTTLGELWVRYLDEYAHPRNKPRTVREEEGVWRRHLAPALKNRSLDEITRQDVGRLHHALRSNIWAANDAVKLLRRLYSFAVDVALAVPEENPARFVKLFKEPARERYLAPAELRKLGKALRECEKADGDPWAIAVVRLLIFTGARAGEILHLRWSDLDLESRVARLADSKTGPKELDLPAPAVAIFASLEKLRHAHSPWVFPGRNPAHPRNDYIKRPWRDIRDRAKIENLRLHDLRHTFASSAAADGFSLRMIGELLGHSQTSTTDRYSHLARTPRQDAVESIAASLRAALEGEAGDTADVVPFGGQGEA